MATNEIRLKLVIDGKEAQGVLLNTDELLKKIRAGAGSTGKGGASDMNAMTQAVGQLGWALGDANMFFVNFRAGMMSVGNNIPMIAQGFLRAGEAAKESGMSISKYFMQSMTGAGGVMLGVNAAMFVMQSLPAIFDSINKSAKEAAQEGLELFNKQLEKASQSTAVEMYNKAYGELYAIKALLDMRMAPQSFGQKLFGSMFGVNGDLEAGVTAAEKKVKAAENKLKEFDERAKTRIGAITLDIENIDNKINAVSKDDPAADQKIRALANEKIAKQKELNKLTGDNTKDKQKALFVSEAELAKQIEQVKQELKKEHSLREQLELRKKLNSLNEQAWKLGTGSDLGAVSGMLRGSELPKITDMTKGPLSKVAVPGKPVFEGLTRELSMQLIGMEALEKGWQSLGSSITQSMAGPLRSLQQSNNLLENMLGNLLNVGLQMAATGIMGGLFNLATGGAGGFLGGLMGALGLTKMAKGGTITEPILGLGLNSGGGYLMGENGHELVIPKAQAYAGGTLNIRVGGTLTGDGTSLRAVIKRLDKIESRYR